MNSVGKDKEPNPWLTIPASDYENHMSSPDVDQLRFLNDAFHAVLSKYHPARILVAGCATGNGFEHIDYDVAERVVALDINPEYLRVLGERYSGHLNKIELVCSDVNACRFKPRAFDLIHCALLFEYLDPAETVRNLSGWLSNDGVLTVILQLPDETLKNVSDTPFNSLKRLESIMRLVDPREFDSIASSNRLRKVGEETRQLKSGKKFYAAVFALRSDRRRSRAHTG